MKDKEDRDNSDRPIRDRRRKYGHSPSPRPGVIWKDPYRLGVLLQLFLIALLIVLLIYVLFPFFAVAGRFGLSVKQVFVVPVAVAAVVVLFIRRGLRLVRLLRGGSRD